jgi:hypothetical protein
MCTVSVANSGLESSAADDVLELDELFNSLDKDKGGFLEEAEVRRPRKRAS